MHYFYRRRTVLRFTYPYRIRIRGGSPRIGIGGLHVLFQGLPLLAPSFHVIAPAISDAKIPIPSYSKNYPRGIFHLETDFKMNFALDSEN